MHVYYSHCVGISLSLSLVLFHFMSSNWRIYSGILNGFHSLGFMQIANFIDCICNHSIAFHQNSSDSFSYCIERYREAWREAKVFGSEITAIPTEWGYSSLACRSFFFCVSCVGFFSPLRCVVQSNSKCVFETKKKNVITTAPISSIQVVIQRKIWNFSFFLSRLSNIRHAGYSFFPRFHQLTTDHRRFYHHFHSIEWCNWQFNRRFASILGLNKISSVI